ncbi:hypothetical protein NUV26_30155 [Burkholderia pseudomultivorans]|uniref:hypothetical protein n=1 Tax=Burkholderia pseudomultivorans TaxID=1207504 RepID=UPI00287491E9|nr:hypothetical protein [Burkholderia pseudomultivorans]MDS0796442.1 hypothetical protein [Burkholderia pseudomultivorans]
MNAIRTNAGMYRDVKQFELDEQIERARDAALRVGAGYYFTDDELDDERLTGAPNRPQDGAETEWI